MARSSTTGSRGDLVLNVSPITFSTGVLRLGRLGYMGDDAYRKLSEERWRTHAFRYDRRTDDVLNVSLDANVDPLGHVEEVDLDKHLLLTARAVQQSLLIWTSSKLPILKANKQLVFWGQADGALLLSQAMVKAGLQPIDGLEVPLRYEIDCRMFWDENDVPFLGLVVNVNTTNVIDLSVSDLLQLGVKVEGKYVCQRRDVDRSYLRPGIELVGRVVSVRDSLLQLADAAPSCSSQIQKEQRKSMLAPFNLNRVTRTCGTRSRPHVVLELRKFLLI